MNELLTHAEFLVHVALPGAVAKPGIATGGVGGEAPSWDVEGGGGCVLFLCLRLRLRFRSVSRFRSCPRLRVSSSLNHRWSRIKSFKKHHLSDLNDIADIQCTNETTGTTTTTMATSLFALLFFDRNETKRNELPTPDSPPFRLSRRPPQVFRRR